MKYKYTIFLIGYDNHVAHKFEFYDYEDVQNIIGYMVDGSKSLNLTIVKEEVKDNG